MEITNEKQMVILDEKGNEHVVEILFTYEHEERKEIRSGYCCQ
jgi:uncharacterized protein YrzB (UPF0473 family)